MTGPLRTFFIDLLRDDNLAEYLHPETREGYIDKALPGDENEDRRNLIRDGSLRDIEQAIGDEHDSPRPKPILIVSPP